MKENQKRYKITRILPLLALFTLVTELLFFTRCANQGMPTGGPKDSIPPFLIETLPAMMSTNFTGKEVRITFNEYIVPDQVSEALVVSPPLTKRPSVRTKSRSLIVTFNEELKPDVTYSMDFKNSVVDNNEQNPYLGLRMLFSTGEAIDTLRVAGMVKNAEKLEPLEKIIVMLYSNLNDTAVMRTKPDYIARTDQRGLYLFDNVKTGTYRIYAINDANSNLMYDAGAEEFAFSDSLIIPTAQYVADPDTLAVGADSLLISGHTIFKPEPVFLRCFTEEIFDQFLDKSIRNSRQKCTFVFGETVKDTLGITLLNHKSDNWYILEHNPEIDSLTMWITDTLVARMDTIQVELAYYQLDSTRQQYLQKDTIPLIFTEKERAETRRRKKEDETPQIVEFQFSDNIKGSGFDLNSPIYINTPEPVKNFDLSAIRLLKADDLTSTPLKIKAYKDTTDWRTYRIDHEWEPNTSYVLEIDSAACINIYGITSQKIKKQFTTQKDDFYGRIILNLTSVSEKLLVQLLENTREEKVIKTLETEAEGTIIFDFLAPAKYRVNIVFDRNHNGKWDPGDFTNQLQPERVAYLPEIVKVRSNWDNQYEWDLKPDPTFRKVLIDKEEEELRLKQLQEQQRKNAEQEREVPQTGSGNPFGMPGN